MIAARKLHARVAEAAEGRLPDWAVAGAERRAHMGRVAALLDEWARSLGLDEAERARWRAAAWLHDALRDERPEALRSLVPERFRDLPGKVLHGPAAAERLRSEGVTSADLLDAVAFHTIGDAGLGTLGRALYVADFLEPGRPFLREWRAELRGQMPRELDDVLREIVRARIGHLLESEMHVRSETVGLWNVLCSDGRPS
jgi:HD superfamily phosphohydrolase YqeK